MATTTPNFGWAVPTSTDLVKDGAVAIETLGDSIDASLVDLKGGTTGQVLTKASGTDMDFSWTAVDPLVILDAKGDLITATAADTPARLAVGTNGQVLTADSTAATGLKWASAAGGGKVLQVVSATTATATTNSTSTYADTTLSATITPTSATSKILVFATHVIEKSAGNANNGVNLRLVRGATALTVFSVYNTYTGTAIQLVGSGSINYLDSPATTSATTYKTQFMNPNNTAQAAVQPNNSDSYITLMEIGA
jgi:trimeric autotransporter adhesin